MFTIVDLAYSLNLNFLHLKNTLGQNCFQVDPLMCFNMTYNKQVHIIFTI